MYVTHFCRLNWTFAGCRAVTHFCRTALVIATKTTTASRLIGLVDREIGRGQMLRESWRIFSNKENAAKKVKQRTCVLTRACAHTHSQTRALDRRANITLR